MSATMWDGLPVSAVPPFGVAVVVWRAAQPSREVLLLHRTLAGEGDWAWTPPSGARMPGEAIEACARRELREETGLELVLTDVQVEGDWALFVAEAPADAAIVLDAEHDAAVWLSLEEACTRCRPTLVADGLRTALASLSP
jgi:8-oxo-dGTP pyrophosphatase MutT (NUDIX family)